MADFRPSSSGVATSQRERTGSVSASNNQTNNPSTDQPTTNMPTSTDKSPKPARADLDSQSHTDKQVQEVLASELGVPAVLHRLKCSIASVKEFAMFLRKRSSLEEDHAQGLRKLCRSTQENMHRPEHKDGSFLFAYDEIVNTHERMADNGLQFAHALHQMYTDLVELSEIAERNRKGWKQSGMAAEQRVAEIEQAMRKSKAKYDSLSEEYDRARTGDTRSGSKMSLFKMQKSPAQHEEDLLRKVQGADQTYHGQVQTLQNERSQLVAKTRPETVKAVQEVIKETDAGLYLQLQKFSSYNEKLLLSNGLTISPLKLPTTEVSAPQPKSLRETVAAVDNERDFTSYLVGQHTRIAPQQSEVKYERNPVLNTQQQTPWPTTQPTAPQQGQFNQSQYPVQTANQGTQFQKPPLGRQGSWSQQSNTPAPPPMGQVGYTFGPGSFPSMQAADNQRPSSQQHSRSLSHNPLMGQQGGPFGMRGNSASQTSGFNAPQNAQGPPQLGALPFQTSDFSQKPPQQQPQAPPAIGGHERRGSAPQNMLSQNPLQQHPPQDAPGQPFKSSSPQPQPGMGPNGNVPGSKPPGKMFRLSLDALYERDGNPVPSIVSQCIAAVELFGLSMEGIYRQSGSVNHINNLKAMFDKDPQNKSLDFRQPANFFQDINSVAGLLKQFFRELPDPLLTEARYNDFVQASRIEDETQRRDTLHGIINSLDDPNYATLRALALHLSRVSENKSVTRMDSHNLAVVFGPTLMGTASNIADSGWQIKVIETILLNTHQIFEDD